jgi:hypothetical protein
VKAMISRQSIRVSLLILLIFVLGGVAGWFVANARNKANPANPAPRLAPGERQEKLLRELTTDLKLTEEQQAQIKSVLTEFGRTRFRMEQSFDDKRFELFEEMASSVRTNLTPDQIPTFDEKVGMAKGRLLRFQASKYDRDF